MPYTHREPTAWSMAGDTDATEVGSGQSGWSLPISSASQEVKSKAGVRPARFVCLPSPKYPRTLSCSGNVPYQVLAINLCVPDCHAYFPPLEGFDGKAVVHQY